MSTGTCTLHSWADGADDDEAEPKMGMRVDERLEYDEDLYDTPPRDGHGHGTGADTGLTGTRASTRARLRSRRVAAAAVVEDGDEGEGEGW